MNPEIDALATDIVREVCASNSSMRPRLGHELPADLAAPAAAAVTIVLPPTWTWSGRLVEDADLPEVAETVTSHLRARAAINHRYRGAADAAISLHRSRPADKAWSTRRPVVSLGSLPPSSSRKPETRARVRLGTDTYTFGPGRTRGRVAAGGEVLGIALDEDLHLLPSSGLAIRVGGLLRHGDIVVSPGPFLVHERSRMWRSRPGRLLVEGEVLDLVRARAQALLGCRAWGDGVDVSLDVNRRSAQVSHGGSTAELRIAPEQGVLRLRGITGSVVGKTRFGRLVLDPVLEAETLPGEVEQLNLGGKWVSLAVSGTPSDRECRTVTVGPERAAGSHIFSGTLLVTDRDATTLRHVGEIYSREGVRSLFKALRPCRVDGRLAVVGDLLPVEEDFTLHLGGSFLHVHAA